MTEQYSKLKIILKYTFFGTIIANFPVALCLAWIFYEVYKGNNSVGLVWLAMFLIFLSFVLLIIMAIITIFVSYTNINSVGLKYYFKHFSIGFFIAFLFMLWFGFSVLAKTEMIFLISLSISIWVGISSTILAKFILPKY